MKDDADAKVATNRMPRQAARWRGRGQRFEFDALAAYLGLLIGIALGLCSPAALPVLTTAAAQLCIAGAIEVGRDGAAECLPP
jgi:hypothetical protein